METRFQPGRSAKYWFLIITILLTISFPASGYGNNDECGLPLFFPGIINGSCINSGLFFGYGDNFPAGQDENSFSTAIHSFGYNSLTGTWKAINPGQGIVLSTNGSGAFYMDSGYGSFNLDLKEIGRDNNLSSPSIGIIETEGCFLKSVHDGFVEWYLNNDNGIEHGIIINTSPDGSGHLIVRHTISGTLEPSIEGQSLFLSGDEGRLFSYSGLKAWDSGGRNLNASLDLSENTIIWTIDDREAEYPVYIDPLVSRYKILNASDGSPDSNFGFSVAISGDYAIIGAPYADPDGLSSAGEAYIFYRNQGGDNNWGQIAVLNASERSIDSFFGYSVSISGDYAVSGAYAADPGGLSSAGQVNVFYRNQGGDNNWGEIATLNASDKSPNSQFGYSVTISGDEIIAGARYADPGGVSNAGQAYIFSRNHGGADNWGEVAILNASDKSGGSSLGYSVSISGDNAIVGAPLANPGGIGSVGQAYIFSRNRGGADNWGEVAILNASDKSDSSQFGFSISISGDNAIVGARCADPGGVSNAGQAYIFSRNWGGADNWGEVAILNATDKGESSNFGNSVSISDSKAVSGASRSDSGGLSQAGQAYLFYKDQGGDNKWGELAVLNASDPAADALFGSSVSISADYILVGAFDAHVDGMADAGQAYLSIFSNPLFSAVNPTTGCGDNTALPAVINGDNFFGKPSVVLKKPGEPDIQATGIILSGTTRIDCIFDPGGASPGLWDLEITNPDGRTVSGAGVFTITVPPAAPTPVVSAPGSSGSQEGLNMDTGVGASQKLETGETAFYELSKGEVYKISFTVARDLKKVMITVKSRDSLMPGMDILDEPVYRYEEAKVYYADSSDISDVIFYFKVPKDWLSSGGHSKEEITMIHYDGERWNDLLTCFTGEDESYYYYSAEVPDFMLSAIAISGRAEYVLEMETVTTEMTRAEETGTPGITEEKTESPGFVSETPPGEHGGSFSSLHGIAFVSIILTGIIGAGVWSRIKRRRYPDWWFEEFNPKIRNKK